MCYFNFLIYDLVLFLVTEDENELLEIMRKLETSGDENNVDNDSILAPLSQIENKQNEMLNSQHLKLSQTLNRSMIVNNDIDCNEDDQQEKQSAEQIKSQEAWNKYLLDSDDDLLNDFSMSLDCLPISDTDNAKR